jgi:ABC-2 type transport system ATP-binding protein
MGLPANRHKGGNFRTINYVGDHALPFISARAYGRSLRQQAAAGMAGRWSRISALALVGQSLNNPRGMNQSLPVLALDRVSRRLSGRTIVQNLDFSLDRGEVLGLLGVNGAGKSTTLRMMAGMLAPSSGQVRLGGADLYANAQAARRDIGYLPEEPPLYGELNVGEYLTFCAKLHGLRGNAVTTAVDRAIERCELGEMRRRLTSLLSKGFRQRVGLAQAIVHEPALIVLDEPASGLDPVQALRLRELIRTLRDTHAVVLSTHVLSDVLACCDRVAILHRGRLRHSGALSVLDAGAALRVRIERSVTVADWTAIPIVVDANALDAHTWRVVLRDGAHSGELATAIAERGFGLQELRADANALEEIFVRIAAEDAATETAA